MSSNRGRKRNDNLPPNRAREVQRAFRARRAAHLQALEQRVTELEEENEYFRQVLNFPSSSRPQLGRGPTGRDQPYKEDKSRRQAISPSGESSAESPSSYASSPELPSLIAPIAPAISNTMTVLNAGPPHRTGTSIVHTSSSHLPSEQGHAIGQPNYADRVLPSFRRQAISLSGEPSAESPSSYASSPELPSLIAPIAPAISNTMTVLNAGPPHRTGTSMVHTSSSHLPSEQGHAIGQPNYADCVLPSFHSPSSSQQISRYTPTPERSVESKSDSRGRHLVRRDADNEVPHDSYYGLSQNYENSEQYLDTSGHGGTVYLQSYHDLTSIHANGVLPSDRVLTPRNELPPQEHSRYMTHNRQLGFNDGSKFYIYKHPS